MAKCIVCKFSNSVAEAERHTNDVTVNLAVAFNNRILERRAVDIERVCEEHRNPLKLNVVLTGFHDKLRRLQRLSAMPTMSQELAKLLEKEGKIQL